MALDRGVPGLLHAGGGSAGTTGPEHCLYARHSGSDAGIPGQGEVPHTQPSCYANRRKLYSDRIYEGSRHGDEMPVKIVAQFTKSLSGVTVILRVCGFPILEK